MESYGAPCLCFHSYTCTFRGFALAFTALNFAFIIADFYQLFLHQETNRRWFIELCRSCTTLLRAIFTRLSATDHPRSFSTLRFAFPRRQRKVALSHASIRKKWRWKCRRFLELNELIRQCCIIFRKDYNSLRIEKIKVKSRAEPFTHVSSFFSSISCTCGVIS